MYVGGRARGADCALLLDVDQMLMDMQLLFLALESCKRSADVRLYGRGCRVDLRHTREIIFKFSNSDGSHAITVAHGSHCHKNRDQLQLI